MEGNSKTNKEYNRGKIRCREEARDIDRLVNKIDNFMNIYTHLLLMENTERARLFNESV